MGRTANNAGFKAHTNYAPSTKDTSIGLTRRTSGDHQAYRDQHQPKPQLPSRSTLRREEQARRYPYSNTVAYLSIVCLAAVVCASLYWVVVLLA